MPISNITKERIAHCVIKVLYSRFASFPTNTQNNRNSPFHIAFLQAFNTQLSGRVNNIADYISLCSWMHGLNTSLGQSFFESVAHILCNGEKRDFRNNQIFTNQISAISDIMVDLKNGDQLPSLERENQILCDQATGALQAAPNFTADCLFETDNQVVAIELKSVRPNSSEMRGEKQKILLAKAILRKLHPNKEIKYFFGFPFDPTANSDTEYDKERFLNYLVEAAKFIDPNEILLADELWSYLSSSDETMSEILSIINTIATPDFMHKFDTIQGIRQQSTNEIQELLREWFLYSEVEILNNISNITDQQEQRILHQTIFKPDGSYNTNRLTLLHN